MKSVWDNLRWFSRDEKWGDPDRMNPILLHLLDDLRDRIGSPFVIHCGYETSGHTKKSQHYYGNAVDFHVKGMSFLEAYLAIDNELEHIFIINQPAAELVGFGIYPDWNHPGFHLDVRGYRARWGRISGQYVALSEALKYAGGKA